MTVALVTGFLIGTSDTAGDTIANNAVDTGTEKDILGNATSEGWLNLYLAFTSTVTAGTMDLVIFRSRVTGVSYQDDPVIVYSAVPKSGTKKIYVANFPASRFMIAQVTNNATGASATNVVVGYELFQES